MLSTIRDGLLILTLAAAVPVVLAARHSQEHQHPATHPEGGAHRHPAAAAIKNAVPANAARRIAPAVNSQGTENRDRSRWHRSCIQSRNASG